MKKYIIVFVVVFIGYFIGDSINKEMTKDKTPGKAKRLACQKKVTTFERAYSIADIKFAQNLIEHGSISFSSAIEKPKYSKSVLSDYITLDEIDLMFTKILRSYVKYNEDNNSGYKLSYYIYENDKNDPGKKTKKSKLYAGYVVFEVKTIKNKSIYKVQVDFMNHKKQEIKNSLECSVKSFMTYNK